MASVIATTDLWCEPNPNSTSKGGYDPLSGDKPFALNPVDSCPCDHCPKRTLCRDEAMACQVFDDYVNPWRVAQRSTVFEARKIPGKSFLKDR